METKKRICRECGKEYETKSMNPGMYCSDKCRYTAANRRKQERKDANRKPRVCECCGKLFTKSFTRGPQCYCSVECLEFMEGKDKKNTNGWARMCDMIKDARQAMECAKTVSLADILCSKTKPQGVSEARWRMELARRKRAEYYELEGCLC